MRKMIASILKRTQRFMAIEPGNVSSAEKMVATLGGTIGIILIAHISFQVTGATGAALIVPAMGASAVLVFAIPHGKLSQPWPLIGGSLVSALVGVACYQLVPDIYLASGLAVGLSIGVMHILGCIHPPGGATALVAVVGGPAIHDLGYAYVLTPILLNVMIIFIIAIVFNAFFPWRRYPAAAMMRFTDGQPQLYDEGGSEHVVDKDTIKQALADMDLVMDVTLDDLQRVIQLSLQHANLQQLTKQEIEFDHFYTNGKHGPQWSVRRIIDESKSSDPQKDMVIYRVVEGQGFNSCDSCTREEFSRWAAREVFPN
ncbi:MAG: HPP family protein [Pseudomonadales bacterium]|nr:HPP family protein [Pseudomonadales bacterium]